MGNVLGGLQVQVRAVDFFVGNFCEPEGNYSQSGAKWDNTGMCTAPKLGYTVDDAVLQLTGQVGLAKIALKALMGILVLHPIACGLGFLSLLASLITTWNPKRSLNVISLIAAILAAVAATIVTVIDIILIPIARTKVEEATKGSLTVVFGNATWMTVAAAAVLWLGVIGASAIACGCFGCGRRRGRRAKHNQTGAEKLHSLDNGSGSHKEMSERPSETQPHGVSV
ncbi:hypothetical protein FRC06_009626 [Ceratobasidium sp. 370]|nr:hypothetical protein FRC06_009626 [Ceratobasidium sp. 370]